MRGFLYALATFGVIGLAYWAYKENYATQDALRRVEKLQVEIGQKREQLGVLRAEWAYLNRPDRLRELADLNYDVLGLIPLAPEDFATVEQVVFPLLDLNDLSEPVDLIATFDGIRAEVPE